MGFPLYAGGSVSRGPETVGVNLKSVVKIKNVLATMNVSRRMCRAGERSAGLIFAMVLALVPAGFAQGDYIPQGGEYGIVNLPGHQVYPDLGLQTSGGYLVWQDSVTDGSGLGISARRIDSSQSGSLS